MTTEHPLLGACEAPTQAPTSSRLSDEDLCAVEYAFEALQAIANRSRLTGDVIEPIANIHKASQLAREAARRLSPLVLSQGSVHEDDLAIERFAQAMKEKMARSRAKGRSGWNDPVQVSNARLAQMLVEHLAKGNAGTFEDVANFAMMLHQRGADPVVLQQAAAAERTSAPADAVDPDFVSDLARSRAKHPGIARMFDGLLGEVHELKRAYAGDGERRAEAFDVAVCAYRIATEGDAGGNAKLLHIPDWMAWDAAAPAAMPDVEVVAYELPGVRIERTRRRGEPESWAVRTPFGDVMAQDGTFEPEPSPSSRDDAFLARCRFPSPQRAYAVWAGAQQPCDRTGPEVQNARTP